VSADFRRSLAAILTPLCRRCPRRRGGPGLRRAAAATSSAVVGFELGTTHPAESGFAAGARSAEPGPPDSPVGTVSLVAVHGTVLQARVDTASPFRNEEWTLNAGPKLRVGRPSYSA